MALLESPRHTAEDLAAWARWEHYDDVLSHSPRLDRAADKAAAIMADFVATHPECFLAVSWGKDSVAVAAIAAMCDLDVPLIWARADRYENPDCEITRDAFLARFPHVRYEERTYTWRVPLRGEPGYGEPGQPSQDALNEVLPDQYISGIRAVESAKRQRAMARHGHASANTCRPIGCWSDASLWAWLHRHDIPIHPAYAMTYGGELDRSEVRVHALRTAVGNALWEDCYYPE